MNADLAQLPVLGLVREQARRRNAAVLLVGGAVRDLVLGRVPNDLDFVVRRNPIGLARAIADALDAAFYVMDAARQTARVIDRRPSGRLVLDFSLCRGATWDEDLRARDFTVNAMAIDVQDGAWLDPLGGRRDLADGIIRLAGPSSIDDDPVRALRAVRMAASLGAALAPETAAAARRAAQALHRPSAERVRDEFVAMLGGASGPGAARQLHALGLLAAVAPEAAAHASAALDLLQAVARRAAAMADDDATGALRAHLARATTDDRSRAAVLALAALLSPAGEAAAIERARALKLSADEARDARAIIASARRAAALGGITASRAVHAFMLGAGECAPEAALLFAASRDDAETQALGRALIDTYFSRYAPAVLPPPFITGDDVLALGVPRGPRVGSILEAVWEAQLIGEIPARAQALALAERIAAAPPEP